MTAWLWLAAMVVVIAWVATALAIRRWGPGQVRRRVLCPEKSLFTHVLAVRSEAGYGAIRTTDIARCDLLAAGPVTCAKRCLVNL